ncbi:GNAT family N-acetyltransferase [Halobacterium litoreum]|uniref:GNAT family N-acetyltransferase n=1 Tax=Halobacterium litoreum TaxID=2039234 RepID=A0ABD5NF29_9EURY|nr:GNAT family N-acetyltransferase [Halobacterium litoreum]UHH13598.1 GNAT family N-acetyltransferase [Halobacterium litoreum]
MTAVEYGATAEELCSLYREYGWWADRDPESVRRALQNTDETVLVRDEAGDPVGAARILTDYVYYAMVYDVIVAADDRGEGVGREVMAAVREHPRLQDVAPSLLAREGLVPFYEACGFEVMDEAIEHPDGDPEPLSWMVHRRRDDEDEQSA